ncbi:hypothetical protein BW247_08950 [Acidihalobacter ferrooxydans]|uniref:HTH tetR-type domain-containing protein n=2 Tax=Acidihalobacter ferrooxydans TaxID=1765967 RepID=A0A1P8UH80_9GAMM|nr:hypothetical protein BW247_08950 [Acidihalobacter ferrooxydans]
MDRPADNTRERILRTATRVFAEKGYNRASVREICQAAGANGAAVHYHFGDKISLYREVLRPAAELTEIPDELRADDTPLRVGLEAYFRPLRTLANDRQMPHMHLLFMREQMQPTGMLTTGWSDFFRPRHEQLCRFLCRHCHAEVIDDAINQLALSLIGMGMMLFLKPDIVQAFAPGLTRDDNALEATLQRLTDQATVLVEMEAERRQQH